MAELGALSLRIQSEGDDQVLSTLRRVDSEARKLGATPLSMYFEKAGSSAAKGMGQAATGATKASAAESALNKEIAEGTRLWTLHARAIELTSKAAVAELRASAAAQQQWLKSINASTEAQTRFNLSVQQFEKRVAAANVQVATMPRNLRAGSSAMVALAIAATGGGTSLRELANSAGLAATVVADLFGPAKWAGYAAGIGAAVVGITALVGIMHRLAQAKPISDVVTKRLENTQTLDDANVKLEQLKRRAEAAQQALADAGKVDLVPFRGLFRMFRAQSEFDQALKQVEEFTERVATMRREQAQEARNARTDATVAAAERTNDLLQTAFSAQLGREQRLYDRGLINLKTFYERRSEIINRQTANEITALEKTAAAIRASARPTDKEADRVQRATQLADIEARIEQARIRGGQAQSDNAEQRRLAEKQLTEFILASEAKIADARGDFHADRKQQIAKEAEAFRLAVLQQTGDAELAAQRARELSDALTRLLDPLNQRMRQVFQAIEASATGTMQAVRQRIEQMLQATGGEVTIDVVLNAEALVASAQRVDNLFADLGGQLGSTFADAIAAAAGGGSGKDAILKSLGGIFGEMGKALIIYGATMSGLLPSLLNPFTSGPAAIAAGIALTALGAALGAAASGSGGATSSGRVAAASQNISISRLVIDPNASLRDRVGSASRSLSPAAAVGGQTIEVIGINTPRGQELIGTASGRYQGRGG